MGAEDRVLRALADESRRKIFERLARGEAPVKDIAARFDISQPAVSQHLAVLKHAGLVAARRDGRNVFYRVVPKGLAPLADWYRRFWNERVDELQKLLAEMHDD
jgi:DNA-binding transcriptional ArsR family regulator